MTQQTLSNEIGKFHCLIQEEELLNKIEGLEFENIMEEVISYNEEYELDFDEDIEDWF